MKKSLALALGLFALLLTSCGEDSYQQYTDFSATTTEGEELTLSEVVSSHKFTILDFWASWCNPCCKEIPTLVEINEQFGEDVAIVSFSLDTDVEAWENAVQNYSMFWFNVSDLCGWDSEIAKLYEVESIPAMILIDQEGNMRSYKQMRAAELLSTLKMYKSLGDL